ncbi:hypothetical protein [Paraglaciecola sp. L3A3]|uniref:hypothetical protein n=1 Tax=Paraglaciecola sp. L3A3 TaxID=2686358 RepID=UPI00131C51CD|nr:hypothetical protein [Paraglaciecola sp. L3A3]
MNSRTKFTIEVSSIVVAFCAFFTATFLGYSEYLDKRAAVLPIITAKISIDTVQKPNKFTLSLDNTGFGAARISYINLLTAKVLDYTSIEINGETEKVFSSWNKEFKALDRAIVLKPNDSYEISIFFIGTDMSLEDYFTGFGYSFECRSVYREVCEVYGDQPNNM